MPPSNYYTVLGVPNDASKEVIDVAYAKLLKQYKANIYDRNMDKKITEIGKMYRILTDPIKRIQYDSYLKLKEETSSNTIDSEVNRLQLKLSEETQKLNEDEIKKKRFIEEMELKRQQEKELHSSVLLVLYSKVGFRAFEIDSTGANFLSEIQRTKALIDKRDLKGAKAKLQDLYLWKHHEEKIRFAWLNLINYVLDKTPELHIEPQIETAVKKSNYGRNLLIAFIASIIIVFLLIMSKADLDNELIRLISNLCLVYIFIMGLLINFARNVK